MATRQICGGVHPDGNTWFGEGFKSRKLKEGTYVIEFDQSFGRQPAPVCTVNGYEWKTFDKSVAVVEIWEAGFVCVTSDPKMPMDCAFTFIVVGNE